MQMQLIGCTNKVGVCTVHKQLIGCTNKVGGVHCADTVDWEYKLSFLPSTHTSHLL